MLVYHVTPPRNYLSIISRGVLAGCSTGKARCSWWVRKDQVPYAIEHIALRHHVCPKSLIIFAANIPDQELVRTNRPGRYQCFAAIVRTKGAPVRVGQGLVS
jgi:hypothetical protein